MIDFGVESGGMGWRAEVFIWRKNAIVYLIYHLLIWA